MAISGRMNNEALALNRNDIGNIEVAALSFNACPVAAVANQPGVSVLPLCALAAVCGPKTVVSQ